MFEGRKDGRIAISIIPPPTPVMAVKKDVKVVIKKSDKIE